MTNRYLERMVDPTDPTAIFLGAAVRTLNSRQHQPACRNRYIGMVFPRLWSWILLLSLASPSVRAADTEGQTMRMLETRKQQQLETVTKFQAFHEFHFADHLAASGITFQHRAVDDAAKNWVRGHYDHGCGIAAADVDGDGLSDILFVNQLGSNELWRNLGGGRFENITTKAGVGLPGRICVGAAFADFDNDGDPDLFVTNVRHGNVLFENLGNGRFRDISKEAGVDYSGHSSGAVWFDFDNDGRLDLFVCNVGKYTTDQVGQGGFYLTITSAFMGHLYPERSEPGLLYKNLGHGKFKNITATAGLNNPGWIGDATFADLNGDRYPDLYLANMQGDDHYFENRSGKGFEEKTDALFPKTSWGAMGLKFFDYNNDGRMDLFVTDMHSDMTTEQERQAASFRLKAEKQKSEEFCSIQYTEAVLQGASNNIFGNSFYENLGGGKFRERSDELNLETYCPWGISTGDLNADGFEDVFVSGGMGYPFRYGINSLLLNEQGKKFFDAEFVLGVEPRASGHTAVIQFILDCSGADAGRPECAGVSGQVGVEGHVATRTSIILDMDGDGDLDIITGEMNSRPQVLLSDLTARKSIHYLNVKLVGSASNRDGLGATVKVYAGDRVFTRYYDGKSGYLGQSPLPLYFGLGAAAKADRVEVAWPSGRSQSVTIDIPTNSLLTVREPATR